MKGNLAVGRLNIETLDLHNSLSYLHYLSEQNARICNLSLIPLRCQPQVLTSLAGQRQCTLRKGWTCNSQYSRARADFI